MHSNRVIVAINCHVPKPSDALTAFPTVHKEDFLFDMDLLLEMVSEKWNHFYGLSFEKRRTLILIFLFFCQVFGCFC